MKQRYQKFTLLILALGTVVLGITTLIISLQLQNRQPVTELPPQAAEPACAVSFTVTPDQESFSCEIAFNFSTPTPTGTLTPTPTPTPAQTVTPTATLTPTVTPTGIQEPTNTPTRTPMPTNTPVTRYTPTATLLLTATPTRTPAPGACNAACTTNTDCANNLICSNGYCRNPQCTEQSSCSCTATPTPEVPVTGLGSTLAGVGVIAGGIFLLLLGLVF